MAQRGAVDHCSWGKPLIRWRQRLRSLQRVLSQFRVALEALSQIRERGAPAPWALAMELERRSCRSRGCQRPGSDIDLAFSGSIDHSAALAGALEALPTPLLDVTHLRASAGGRVDQSAAAGRQ